MPKYSDKKKLTHSWLKINNFLFYFFKDIHFIVAIRIRVSRATSPSPAYPLDSRKSFNVAILIAKQQDTAGIFPTAFQQRHINIHLNCHRHCHDVPSYRPHHLRFIQTRLPLRLENPYREPLTIVQPTGTTTIIHGQLRLNRKIIIILLFEEDSNEIGSDYRQQCGYLEVNEEGKKKYI